MTLGMPVEIEEVEPVMSVDQRTVLLWGWTGDPAKTPIFLASVDMPIEIDDENLLTAEWKTVAVCLDWERYTNG
jgi:hypothetical protein